jgi:hypothetical protein
MRRTRMFGHKRIWKGGYGELGPVQKLIVDIGWVTGTDVDGKTLYHFDMEEAEEKVAQFMRETIDEWEVFNGR